MNVNRSSFPIVLEIAELTNVDNTQYTIFGEVDAVNGSRLVKIVQEGDFFADSTFFTGSFDFSNFFIDFEAGQLEAITSKWIDTFDGDFLIPTLGAEGEELIFAVNREVSVLNPAPGEIGFIEGEIIFQEFRDDVDQDLSDEEAIALFRSELESIGAGEAPIETVFTPEFFPNAVLFAEDYSDADFRAVFSLPDEFQILREDGPRLTIATSFELQPNGAFGFDTDPLIYIVDFDLSTESVRTTSFTPDTPDPGLRGFFNPEGDIDITFAHVNDNGGVALVTQAFSEAFFYLDLGVADLVDHADTRENAFKTRLLGDSLLIEGSLEASDGLSGRDHDWFVVSTAGSTGGYVVDLGDLSQLSISPRVEIYVGDDAAPRYTNEDQNGFALSQFTFDLDDPGQPFFIHVSGGPLNAETAYRLDVRRNEDPGGDVESASLLSSQSPRQSHLEAGEDDWFEFNEAGTVAIRALDDAAFASLGVPVGARDPLDGAELSVVDAEGSVLAVSRSGELEIGAETLSEDVYLVVSAGVGDQTGAYVLEFV